MMSILALAMKHRAILAALLLVGTVVALGATTGGFPHAATFQVDPQTDENAAGYTGHVEFRGETSGAGQYITSGEDGFKSQAMTAQGIIEPTCTGAAFSCTGQLGGNLCSYQYRVFVNSQLGELGDAPLVPTNGDVKAPVGSGHFASPVIGYPIPGGRNVINTIPLESYSFTLNGKVEGAIRVELWGYLGTGLHRLAGPCDTWFRIGYDGAALKDGSGGIHIIAGASDKFQEGDTVQFDVTTNFGHWTAAMYDGRGNLACGLNAGGGFNPLTFFFPAKMVEYDPGDNPLGSVSLLPPITGDAGASSSDPSVANLPSGAGPGSDAAAVHCKAELQWDGKVSKRIGYVVPHDAFEKNGNNVWRIVLMNTFTEHGTDQFVTLDQRVLAPEPPRVNVTDPSGADLNACHAVGCAPDVGDTVTYRMTSRLNLESNSPIDHCLVYLWYGETDLIPATDSPAWIARGVSVPSVAVTQFTYECTYPYTITKPDEIHSRLYAVDKDGRPSGSSLNTGDQKELVPAYTPPPNSTGNNSGEYTQPPNGDSRPVVDPKGSDNTLAGPAEPPAPHADSTLLLLGVIVILSAFLIFVAFKQWPMLLRAAAFIMVVAVVTTYAWFSGAIPGVS